MNTKKALIYGGGAIVFGAITFFVWSFFQKPIIPIGDTTISLGEQPEEDSDKTNTASSGSNPFSFTPTKFDPIKTPNILSDLDKLMYGNNP